MGKLSEILLSQKNRPLVVKDCVRLIDDEVSRKSGLSGIAIKGGYKVFKKVRPTAVEDAMDSLLDEFVGKLEPIYDEYLESGKGLSLEKFLPANGGRVANTLLGITDARAENSPNKVIRKAYMKLRPLASRQVEEALPGVGRLVGKYASA